VVDLAELEKIASAEAYSKDEEDTAIGRELMDSHKAFILI
jgi:hypothetical protein